MKNTTKDRIDLVANYTNNDNDDIKFLFDRERKCCYMLNLNLQRIRIIDINNEDYLYALLTDLVDANDIQCISQVYHPLLFSEILEIDWHNPYDKIKAFNLIQKLHEEVYSIPNDNIDVVARYFAQNEDKEDYTIIIDELLSESSYLLNLGEKKCEQFDYISDTVMHMCEASEFDYISQNYIQALRNEIYESAWDDLEKSRVYDLLKNLNDWSGE